MSFRAMRNAWDAGATTSTQLLVLLALADFKSKNTGRCDPSISQIADKCNLGVSSVKSALNFFEAKGIISREQRMGVGKRPRNTSYTLNFDVGQDTTNDSHDTTIDGHQATSDSHVAANALATPRPIHRPRGDQPITTGNNNLEVNQETEPSRAPAPVVNYGDGEIEFEKDEDGYPMIPNYNRTVNQQWAENGFKDQEEHDDIQSDRQPRQRRGRSWRR